VFFRRLIASGLGDVTLQVAQVVDDFSEPDRSHMVDSVVVSAVDEFVLVRKKKQLGQSMLTTITHCRRTKTTKMNEQIEKCTREDPSIQR